jgi:hypothetical protein
MNTGWQPSEDLNLSAHPSNAFSKAGRERASKKYPGVKLILLEGGKIYYWKTWFKFLKK